MVTAHEIQELTGAQLIGEGRDQDHFIGRLYFLDYERARVLISDAWRDRAMGIPQGAFLLAYSDRDTEASDILLLRALAPSPLSPEDSRLWKMIDHYRGEMERSGAEREEFPSWEFSFSGLECRVLGSFFRDQDREGREILEFGSGTEELRSPSSYSVYKPVGEVLQVIARWRLDSGRSGAGQEYEIGALRYRSREWASSLDGTDVPVTVNPGDFPGRVTGVIGSSAGATNTLQVLMEAAEDLSRLSEFDHLPETSFSPTLEPFNASGAPYYPVGQVVFDTNGAFGNPDETSPLDELFDRGLTRYSLDERPGHIILRVNFFDDVLLGFELVKSFLSEDEADYVRNFTQVDLTPPEDDLDFGTRTRWARKRAAYLCCLYRAGFQPPPGYRIRFQGNNTLDSLVRSDGSIRPSEGITFQQAVNWFSTVWDHYHSEYFRAYQDTHDGREWADEDLKALLVFLTRKRFPGGNAYVSGYRKLTGVIGLHTVASEKPFHRSILDRVRGGGAVIVDISRGDAGVGRAFAEVITREIFTDAIVRFIRSLPNNLIQLTFSDVRAFFPGNGARGSMRIFDRLIREGGKLRLGVVYSTPEISGLSETVLSGTQNWLVSHLPMERELAELSRHRDFSDFAAVINRPVSDGDQGTVWVKTLSSPYILPVRMNRFPSGIRVVPFSRTVERRRERTGEFPGRFDHQRVVP